MRALLNSQNWYEEKHAGQLFDNFDIKAHFVQLSSQISCPLSRDHYPFCWRIPIVRVMRANFASERTCIAALIYTHSAADFA